VCAREYVAASHCVSETKFSSVLRLNDDLVMRWLAAKTLAVIDRLRNDAELESCATAAHSSTAVGVLILFVCVCAGALPHVDISLSADVSTDVGRFGGTRGA
jgi:hypothetical protein